MPCSGPKSLTSLNPGAVIEHVDSGPAFRIGARRIRDQADPLALKNGEVRFLQLIDAQ